MARHVVGPVADLPPGTRRIIEAGGRSIGVFNIGGTFVALRNQCPHQGAALCEGTLGSFVSSDGPGRYQTSRPGEMLRCPWHGWEFDVRTGQSWLDPRRVRVRSYEVAVVAGAALSAPAPGLEPGPYAAETFPVSVESDYVVVEA